MVRAYALPALENVALWHERDISHSSVERMIGPGRDRDARFRAGAAGRRHRQARRLPGAHAGRTSTGSAASSIRSACSWRWSRAGLSREAAYALVQRNAMKVWDERRRFPERASRRQGGRAAALAERRDPRDVRPRLSHQARRHDFPAGFRGLLSLTKSRCPCRRCERSPARSPIFCSFAILLLFRGILSA